MIHHCEQLMKMKKKISKLVKYFSRNINFDDLINKNINFFQKPINILIGYKVLNKKATE
jgi:uncharacterized FlaG/YvyC family protein